MSSSTLFKLAGGIFLLIPVGHTQMYLEILAPGLKSLGVSPSAYASKVSWNQANGYFITSGTSLPYLPRFSLVPSHNLNNLNLEGGGS